ncbi:tetratricopeptide repeat protein [Lignipirellula cremea]|uniref:Photosystem I assembly protein Ycf3 n=1 Tax=Lignipirellula cremea TaxID=2528010 RepID=A0A518DRQ0_9BACT|nr:tetratricopeptide repeat protein [Lignipirellula cremea]QDU94509.1 photosystem I assembly protein Ycf3 [Lignipirellula cremea]
MQHRITIIILALSGILSTNLCLTVYAQEETPPPRPASEAETDNLRERAQRLIQEGNQLAESEKFSAAVAALSEALSILTDQYGQDDGRTREIQVQLAHTRRVAKLTPEQRQQLKQAAMLNQEAVQNYRERQYQLAAGKSNEVLAIRRQLLGDEDPLTLTSMHNGAMVAANLGDDRKAEEGFREVTRARLSLFGSGHPSTRDSMERLSSLLARLASQRSERDEFAQALANRREILQLYETLEGKDHWRVTDARLAVRQVEEMARLPGESRKQLEKAAELDAIALPLYRLGNYEEALVPWNKALTIRQRLLGKEHPDTAASLNNLGNLYYVMGKYAEAKPYYQQALEIRAKTLGHRHPQTALSLSALGNLYYSMSNYVAGKPYLQQSLEIRTKVLGDRHLATARSLDDLGNLNSAAGDFADAEPLLEQALEIRRSVLGGEHSLTIQSMRNLANLYKSWGNYLKAEPLYRQLVEIRTKQNDEESADFAGALSDLATIYERLGDYDKAEPLYQKCLEIRERVQGEDHPETVTMMLSLGGLYRAMEDYPRAEPMLQRARKLYEKTLGEEHFRTAEAWNALGLYYKYLGDYRKAEAAYRRSLDIRKKVWGLESAATAASLNNLAAMYRSTGDYQKGEELARQCLEIREKVLGVDHLHTAMARGQLAQHFVNDGKYAEAERTYLENLELFRRVLSPDHPHTATCLYRLALVYVKKKEYTKAEPLLQQSLAICSRVYGEQSQETAARVSKLASLYASVGDWDQAQAFFRRGLRSTRDILRSAAIVQSEREQLAMAKSLRYQLDTYLQQVIGHQLNCEDAFREVLAWKGATLVRQRQMRKVAENADVAPLFHKLQQTASRLATLSRMIPDQQQQAAWRRQLTDLTAEKERLEAELSQKSSKFRQTTKVISLEDMLIALPKNAALVDFLEYQQQNPQDDAAEPRFIPSLLAFIVRDNKPIVLLDLGPVAPLGDAIDTWRRTFGASHDGLAAGRLLRERIWEPVEQHLSGCQLVLLSGDGALGRLPVGALPGKGEGTYLLEEYRLAMLPVPQLLPALVSELGRKELSGGLLLMGDVDYDADPEAESDQPRRKSWKRSSTALVRGADLHFSHLDATAGEIATIKEVFADLFQPRPDEIQTLKQTEATEQHFREAASKFYNLHLATHGFFADPEKKSALAGEGGDDGPFDEDSEAEHLLRGINPGLLSGLAFSGANRKPEADKDDGILTADEIASLSLDGVDLVVLSACETGLGQVAGGEGLLGVQRAFQVAGARSTVASLWQVGDVATRRLMERFYRNYWEQEMSKLDALREAQLWLLHHPEEIRGDRRVRPSNDDEPQRLSPQFWAAFQLSGDWR